MYHLMMADSEEVIECRLCKGQVQPVFNFGSIYMTGVFAEHGMSVERAPVVYGMCSNCGLNQLMHNYDSDVLYGSSYGYESHLNPEMRGHLKHKAKLLEKRFLYESNPRILDIASNDGTFLSFFSPKVAKVGIDPLIGIVGDYYPANSTKIVSFFSDEGVLASTNGELFDLVTSNSVLYDLESPLDFAKGVFRVLKNGGIWHFEQSYLPKMVETLSIDTICHEHLLYLGATQIHKLLRESGFQLLEASLNDVNGGSIAITAVKEENWKGETNAFFDYLLKKEKREGYLSGHRISRFFEDAEIFKGDLLELVDSYSKSGHTIFGIGASTKGNMLLQFCGLNQNAISKIGEINPKKFGKQTPGTSIPICDEKELLEEMACEKSIGVVFPWHFRNSIRKATSDYVSRGGKILFPLPNLEIETL
jgi:SAM-dependent methyltransferase